MKIEKYEPLIFILFGIFHLHRIWGLIDRKSYAAFWIGVMEQKTFAYFLLSGILAALCIWGIWIFLKNLHHNFWWRWIYVFCGGYVLFDLFAITIGLQFWHNLILAMYDVSTPYWNLLWVSFIVIGGISFVLGFKLMIGRTKQKKQNNK